MADLSFSEKRSLEKLLGMGSGYVLSFSDRTFREFVMDAVGKDIYEQKYAYATGSKANRLRGFWAAEANHVVGALLVELIKLAQQESPEPVSTLVAECKGMANRLLQELPVREINALASTINEKEFEHLEKSVRDAIERNNPESGLDHLHTYMVKFIRVRGQRRGINVTKDKPLHSLFGEYIKLLKAAGLIESEMSERILKTAISHMEAFNDVRNNKSLAHDNKVLGYEEALFLVNNVTSSIRFLRSIDPDKSSTSTPATSIEEDDLSF